MTDTATSGQASGARRWLMLSALATVSVVTAALGVWQVQRLAWKQDLIARVDARVAAAPVAPPAQEEWPRLSAREHEYRHVTATGTFLHAREVLVTASTERGPGYWVMTPVALADGSFIVVNRGFVPAERRDPSRRAEGQVVGKTRIVGLLRMTEAHHWILRANDPIADRWYRRDPGAIAAARGLSTVAPYFIDADATPNAGGWPVGGLTRISFTNHHLVYALTWFALAALAAGGAVYVQRTDFRRQSAPHSAASM